MVRTWQSADGKLSQPEIGSPEWKAFVQAHFERAKDSFGQVSLKQIGPFEVQDHPLPYDQVKSQYYRRLLGDGQFTLPIIVEERPEGGYRLVDGIHRLGVHQSLNRPVMALIVHHGLQKMAIKDIRMGRRIPASPGHMLGYHRFDYSHILPSSLSSQGYRLNVYHDPESADTEERFVTAVLTHPKTLHTSRNFPGQVGAVSAHLQTNGELSIGTASIDEAHRGGKGLPLYEALLTHASKKLGAHTVTGGWHSTMAHKVHQKLALKHGMDYNAGPNKAMKTPENTPSGPHDGKFDSYSYAIKNEAMEKAIGPFIASMMMAASPGPTDQSVEQPKHQIAATLYKPWSPEGLHEDLHPIAHLESSWGKNIAHGKGKSEMDTAFGALGFKPQTAFEEYGRSKKIQKEHPGLNDSETFLNEFRGNPSFYNKIASQHFARLKALHGTAQKAAYAWRWGSRAASEAAPETIDNEPYVQKYTAYKSAKKLGKSQREKEPTRIVSVAAYNEDGLLLFGLRGDTSKWCLPGGHLEPGEDKLDGAKRELKEETGLEGINWKYLGSGEVPDKGVHVFCFTCDVEGFPDADSDPDLEFLHFEWVDSNEIPEHIRSALHNKHDINLELQDIDHGELSKSEDLVKMAAKKPKIAPEEKNLVVTHNISDLGLEHAHKMGGLPAPSLAVAHKDHPLEGFGDITLVAHHSLADPAQHPVFDADIYSPRQPRSQHKFNDKKMSKLVEELRPHFKAIGSDWASSIGDEFKKYGPNLTRAGSYNVARGLQHRWLTEQGVEIPNHTKPKGLLTPFTQEPALQNFFKEHGVNSQYDYDSDYGKKLGEATRAAINSWNPEGVEPEDLKDMRDYYHKEFIDPDNGNVFFGRSSRIFKDHANFGQNEPDSQKMNEWVENKTKELGEEKFHEWAEKKLESFSEGQYIPKHSPATGNVRKIPYTLDNILKEMTKTVRQGEDFNYGLGSIRAGGAKKFKNLEQMRQHQGQIMPKKEFEKVKEHMNERWNALNEELSPYHGSKMSSMSALGEAISESYKRGRYLGSQLKLSGFDHVPPEVQRKVHEFAQDLVRMPTEYFESKPQRVVGLNEFKGAVIPHDSHPRIEQRLKENGIHDVRFYDKNKEGDRAKAIRLLAEAQNLHLSEDEFYGETLVKELDHHLEKMGDMVPTEPPPTKVADESGKPLVMYHGTKQPGVSAFDTNRKIDKYGRPNVGAYFSSDKEYAQSYGPHLHTVQLDIRNPYVIHDNGHSNRYHEVTTITPERHQELVNAGHDGIVYHWTDPEFGHMPFHEVVAFHPHQIKPLLSKARPGPTFPQLGVGDDRRETDQVTTPRQLKIKQLAQANAAASESDKKFDQIYGSGAATYGNPDEMKARARSRIKQDFTQPRGNLGAAPARGATSASYALGTPWLAGPQYSPSTPNAIQLHENNHMVFKRIEEQHGHEARKNLAQNLWHHAEQVAGPEASKILNRYLGVRYPMKYRGAVDHEERIGTVLNLVNDPGERALVAMNPEYAHVIGKKLPNGQHTNDMGPLMDAAKKVHQTLHAAGAVADRDWLAPHPEFREFYPEMAKDNGWGKPAKPATAKPAQMSDDELLAELGKNEVKWFTDDQPGTRILALKSKNPNPKILEDALNDENPYVREFAAQHPALTFEHLFSALSHKDPATRLAALKNPGITEEHLEFAQHDPHLADEVLKHPKGPTNKVGDLTKNIGYVEFPKLGQGVATKPMVLSIDQAKDRKVLMGDQSKSVSGGKMFYNENVKPDKRLPARQRKMSGYVLDNSGDALKGRVDHEAQHSVFQAIGQKHGTHAHHAAVEHVLGAISDRERSILTMLNPQLAKYPAGKRGEEMIAYMQNFLQDRSRREAALANFAPNGRRLTEVGQRKVTTTLKDMWKRMRNRAHEFGPEHIEAYKKRVMKSDTDTIAIGEQLIKQIPGHQEYNVLQDLAGSSLVDAKVIKAAEFLSGKKCDMMKFRHAFWQTEDQYTAGLMSVDMEPTEDNKKALKSIADLQEVNKGENHVDAGIKEVKAVFKEDQHIAEALQRGVDSQSVTIPELEGKHVGGIRTIQDPNSKEVFLLKPGSGSVSPAAGVSNQPASPSQREACFYEVAKLVGLEDRFVETHLMNVDGKYVAAMHMLPHNWTNLEKLKFQSKSMPGSVLEKYRVTGELHTWGILDYILGNPDRHGQNLMVGPEEENHPIQLIDHGSALAGDGFDPAHDEDSFIPYYFRAWNQRTFRNTDSPEQRLKLMPKTSDTGRAHIQEFILKLNPAELEGVLAKYNVDPAACLKRLEHVKHLLSNGIALDEGVNKLWVLGA